MWRRIFRSLRNNILMGLFLITPITIAVFVVNWLFTFVTDRVIKFLPNHMADMHPEFVFRFIALVLFLSVLFLLGVLIRNILGQRLYRLSDALLERIPVFNKIYVSVRQISEALLAQSQTLFKEVVLVEYPRKGVYSIGFVTTTVPETFMKDLPASHRGQALVSVFIPTTPNPTSGLIILAPRSEVIPIPLNVGDAMKLVVSGGVVYPGEPHSLDDRPTFLDKLRAWASKESEDPAAGGAKPS